MKLQYNLTTEHFLGIVKLYFRILIPVFTELKYFMNIFYMYFCSPTKKYFMQTSYGLFV